VQKELQHSRFVVFTEARGRSFPEPLGQKGRFLAAVVLEPLWAASGIFENQCAAIAERDFGWLPSGALVILPGIIPYRLPFLIEPVHETKTPGLFFPTLYNQSAPVCFRASFFEQREGFMDATPVINLVEIEGGLHPKNCHDIVKILVSCPTQFLNDHIFCGWKPDL
jgi:hypothetical protein